MRELHAEVFEGTEFSLPVSEETGQYMEKMVENFEKNIIKHACENFGSTRKVARALGISQTQLVRKKKKYEL